MKSSDKEVPRIRLQVFLSHNGVCSRRKAFDRVKAGDVKVNGKVVREPSHLVSDKDKVIVDGKGIYSKDYMYVLMNKKAGYITSRSDQHRQKTVFALLPKKWQSLAPVGRLDKDTEGLLLLTNDGDMAYKLTHPKFNIDKTYFVMVSGLFEGKAKKNLERGIFLEGKKTAPAKIAHLKRGKKQTTFQLTIHEGRKRQIRLVCQALGHKVLYLKRLRQGPLSLGQLQPGETRLLKKSEIQKVQEL